MSNKPVISKEFTIEDIHRLREYNYEQTKNMTVEERNEYYNSKGLEVHSEVIRMVETGRND